MNSKRERSEHLEFHRPFFFTDPALISEIGLELTGTDAHHLAVRRARIGDHITVGDGAGRILQARIESVSSTAVSAVILSAEQLPAHRPQVTVLQGLAKGSKVDWAIEKMVELGVDRVAIFASGRSVPLWDEAKNRAALERWHRVAHAAAKQSRRAWQPVIEGPLTSAQAQSMVGAASRALVGDPEAAMSLKQALLADPGDEVVLIVGPEGGLEAAEIAAFGAAGAIAVGMGSQILRTETAGMAMAAIVMFQAGRFG